VRRARRHDGSLLGQNNHGQLGDGTDVGTDGDSFRPSARTGAVGTLDGIIDISMWADHTCAITDDDGTGRATPCGAGDATTIDQLGDGTNEAGSRRCRCRACRQASLRSTSRPDRATRACCSPTAR
jgi:hypothetical protein